MMMHALNIINNWPIITDRRDPSGKALCWQLHVEKAWASKAALVCNDLSKQQELKTFSNKQNTMLKVVLKTYLVKRFDWNR